MERSRRSWASVTFSLLPSGLPSVRAPSRVGADDSGVHSGTANPAKWQVVSMSTTRQLPTALQGQIRAAHATAARVGRPTACERTGLRRTDGSTVSQDSACRLSEMNLIALRGLQGSARARTRGQTPELATVAGSSLDRRQAIAGRHMLAACSAIRTKTSRVGGAQSCRVCAGGVRGTRWTPSGCASPAASANHGRPPGSTATQPGEQV